MYYLQQFLIKQVRQLVLKYINMQNKFKIKTIILLVIISFFVFNYTAVAMVNSFNNNLKSVGGKAYYDDGTKEPIVSDPGIIVANMLYYLLSFMGMIFMILIVTSGIQWMTAGGNSDKITKARTRMINAVIGFGLVILSLAITYGVNYYLQLAASQTT